MRSFNIQAKISEEKYFTFLLALHRKFASVRFKNENTDVLTKLVVSRRIVA